MSGGIDDGYSEGHEATMIGVDMGEPGGDRSAKVVSGPCKCCGKGTVASYFRWMTVGLCCADCEMTHKEA